MNRYVGLWRRLSIEDARGTDRTTQVCWLQSRDFYCDLRVPWPRPFFSGDCLDDYSEAQLEWLLGQQGFAGVLHVRNGVECLWHRHLDFQPDTSVIDAGRMAFGDDRVVEHGIHQQYREEWHHSPPANGTMAVLELIDEQEGDIRRARRGVLVIVGDWFMYARGRLPALPAAPSLRFLADGAPDRRAALVALADCEISFGLRTGPSPWQIKLSSLPFREGQALFPSGAWPQHPCDGVSMQRVEGKTRHWRVHAWHAEFPV